MNVLAFAGSKLEQKEFAKYIVNHNINVDEVIFISEKQKKTNKDFDASFFKSNITFKYGTYSNLKNASILVIASCNIEHVCANAVKNNFTGIYVVATNDVNIDCYKIYKLTNVATYKVVGIGTINECNNITEIVSKKLKISKKNINSYVIGDKRNYIVPFYISNIGVMSLYDCFSDEDLSSIIDDAINKNENNSKIESLIELIDVMINNECQILCVSSYDMETGIYLSMPSIVDKNGVRDVISLDLNEQDLSKLQTTINSIKKEI